MKSNILLEASWKMILFYIFTKYIYMENKNIFGKLSSNLDVEKNNYSHKHNNMLCVFAWTRMINSIWFWFLTRGSITCNAPENF